MSRSSIAIAALAALTLAAPAVALAGLDVDASPSAVLDGPPVALTFTAPGD